MYTINSLIEIAITFFGITIINLALIISLYNYYSKICHFLRMHNRPIPKILAINYQQVYDFANDSLTQVNSNNVLKYKDKINFNIFTNKKFKQLKISFLIVYFSLLISYLLLGCAFFAGPEMHSVLILIIEIILIIIMTIINWSSIKTMYYCNKLSKAVFTKVY